MEYYSKAIAAAIGFFVVVAAGFGLDFGPVQEVLIQAVIGVVTVLVVYFKANKPVTVEQRKEAREVIHEGIEKEQEASE